jgi:hypothetical protein
MAKKSGKAASTSSVKSRRVKQAKYSSFKLHKRIKHPVKLPNVWRLSRAAGIVLWQHKRLFAGLTLIYGLLNLLLVQGIAGNTDTTTLKQTLDQGFAGHFGALLSGLGVFTVLISSAGNSTDQTAGAYQVFLALISSLAIIWGLRQVLAGNQLRWRDPFYRGMYPLIPFILVLVVIGLQLLPLLIGASLYSTVISNGIAVYAVEKLVWALLYVLLALLSLYMVSSSLFALYIVTLPDMTPMKALRSARELVRHRRWTVLRKVLFLPLLLLIVAGVIMVPIIIWLTPLAQWTFFILTMSALLAIHAYMYTLYRELLNE